MKEEKVLEYQVEQEKASVRIIPEDIFMKRDLIPIYGLFSSGWRWLKECGDCITATREESIGRKIRRDLRVFTKFFEFYAVGVYNVGTIYMAETLYTMLKN